MHCTPPRPAGNRPRQEEAEPILHELEQVLQRVRQTLEDNHAQEADLRDGLYELRRVNDAADPFWLIIDISRSSAYAAAIREARDHLLARTKALNPQITSWDKAIDPTLKVSEISTRAGKKKVRPFQPPIPLLRVLQGANTSHPDNTPAEDSEREEQTESQEMRSALRVPVEPAPSENHTGRNQPQVGAGSRSDITEPESEPTITRAMVADIQETVAGMKRFLARMEEMESHASVSVDHGPPQQSLEYEPDRERAHRSRSRENSHARSAGPPTREVVALPKSPWAPWGPKPTPPSGFKRMLRDKGKETPRVPRCRISHVPLPKDEIIRMMKTRQMSFSDEDMRRSVRRSRKLI